MVNPEFSDRRHLHPAPPIGKLSYVFSDLQLWRGKQRNLGNKTKPSAFFTNRHADRRWQACINGKGGEQVLYLDLRKVTA